MKKHLCIIFVLIAIGLSPALYGQDTISAGSVYEVRLPPYNNYFKFALSNITEIESSLQFGIEYPVSKTSRMAYEVGYISAFNPMFFLMADSWPDQMQANGFRIRATYKKYFDQQIKRKPNKYKYFAISLMFKYFDITDFDNHINRMDGFFWEIVDLKTTKYVSSVHALYGYDKYLGKSNEIFMEHCFGIGLRYKYINTNIDKESFDAAAIWYDRFDGLMLSAMWKIRFGFKI